MASQKVFSESKRGAFEVGVRKDREQDNQYCLFINSALMY